MSDWQAGRWLGWDGRWRDGAPPDGWWRSADGRWHAPDAPSSRPHANPAPPGGAYLDPAYHDEPDIGRPADEADAGKSHTGPHADEPYRSDDTEWADDDGSYSFGYSYTDTYRDEDDPDRTAPYGAAGYDPSGYGAPPYGPADAETAAGPVPSSAPFHAPGPPVSDRAGRTGGGGVFDRLGTWPTWVQVAVPATIGLLVLGLLGAAFGEPENDTTAASGTTTTAPAAESTTTAAPPSTTAPPPTTAPPTTPPTTLPTTTTAAPPPTPPPTAAPTAAPPDVSGCHPSYTGACVPANAIDVDCAGGQGDGPDYVDGPLQVVGPDVYDLDGNDNDGTACES